jgi:hypothetical protein
MSNTTNNCYTVLFQGKWQDKRKGTAHVEYRCNYFSNIFDPRLVESEEV